MTGSCKYGRGMAGCTFDQIRLFGNTITQNPPVVCHVRPCDILLQVKQFPLQGWNQWLAQRRFSRWTQRWLELTLAHHWNPWLAQRHIILSLSNVGTTNVQWLGQRWTTIYFCQMWATIILLPTLDHPYCIVLYCIVLYCRIFI